MSRNQNVSLAIESYHLLMFILFFETDSLNEP